MTDTRLHNEFQYYLDHQAELVKRYNGKIIVLKEGQVLGAYTSYLEAVKEASSEHEMGTFLVQECTPGDEAYTLTICNYFLVGMS